MHKIASLEIQNTENNAAAYTGQMTEYPSSVTSVNVTLAMTEPLRQLTWNIVFSHLVLLEPSLALLKPTRPPTALAPCRNKHRR